MPIAKPTTPSFFADRLRAIGGACEAARSDAVVGGRGRARAGAACVARDVCLSAAAGGAAGRRVRDRLTASSFQQVGHELARMQVLTFRRDAPPPAGKVPWGNSSAVSVAAAILTYWVGAPVALIGGLMGAAVGRSRATADVWALRACAPLALAFGAAAVAIDLLVGGVLQAAGCALGAAVGLLRGAWAGACQVAGYGGAVAEYRAAQAELAARNAAVASERAAAALAQEGLAAVLQHATQPAEAAAMPLDMVDLLRLGATGRAARAALAGHTPAPWWRQMYGDNVPLDASDTSPNYRRLVLERARHEDAHLPAYAADAGVAERRRMRAAWAPRMVGNAQALLARGEGTGAALTLLALAGQHLAGSAAKQTLQRALEGRPLEAAYFAAAPDDGLAAAWTALARAWHGGLADVLRLVRAAGVSLDVVNRRSGLTSLQQAVLSGDQAQMEMLLAAGAALGARGRQGQNCLHVAAARADAGCLSALLAHGGATPDHLGAHNEAGETPLAVAARRGGSACLQALLGAGTDTDAQRPGQLSALLREAAVAGRAASVRLLLEAGADVVAAAPSGESLVTRCLRAAPPDVVPCVEALLLAGAGAQESMSMKDTICLLARGTMPIGDATQIVRHLLRHGATFPEWHGAAASLNAVPWSKRARVWSLACAVFEAATERGARNMMGGLRELWDTVDPAMSLHGYRVAMQRKLGDAARRAHFHPERWPAPEKMAYDAINTQLLAERAEYY